ncbi:MAG: exodeoxyribonuclease III [Guyparkeria sp.]|uniref:exodeoxyribonuclease III n=1 Tax=Guyparkeria sp. TaxID=2035736 RepID=UPI00397E002D
MNIVTWNVNSLKVRQPQVLDWLAEQPATLLGLQELKQTDEAVDRAALDAAGYRILSNGQKTYNGVAWVYPAHWPEPTDVVTDIPEFEDPQRRVIAATFGDLRVINLYVVNGEAVGSEKYRYKLEWLEALARWLAAEAGRYRHRVVVGDFNIAPTDADVHDPEAWHERILCSTPERDALDRILETGLIDAFRLFDQPENAFSWWDYRAANFRRNRGLRIDLILVSDELRDRARACHIDVEPRRWERPSDHAPVVLELDYGAPGS